MLDKIKAFVKHLGDLVKGLWLSILSKFKLLDEFVEKAIKDLSSNRNKNLYLGMLGCLFMFKFAANVFLGAAALVGFVVLFVVDRLNYGGDSTGTTPTK